MCSYKGKYGVIITLKIHIADQLNVYMCYRFFSDYELFPYNILDNNA